ncbi:PBP1A family penicillin-binding protein [Vagococcus xieshaowenii]|uniref:PBP1A family penicillin-binding protein n=1 Tax=Vagococcus xieshaowenii TaxID=2562451 RepID=A0AAJ5EFT8_9ENTE|nr:PBP1A family penicillin-binding protein [Vagococcus xieshaowenii]QCA28572.1 PBP1A family penicillin-binding protein [Vagococcus xieshaowenii]TFZ40620.1 PBP1A family penicillin-binding protein [Vagococcus xieshaowenii]
MTNNKKETNRMSNHQRNNFTTKKSSSTKKNLLKALAIIALIGCLGMLTGLAIFVNYARQAPALVDKELEGIKSSDLYDVNNEVFYTLGSIKREVASSERIPTELKNAIISIEDKRFEKHIGVDPIRIFGALASNITGTSSGLQGGSTLTQQLIKLSFFDTSAANQTVKRKAQEAWMAVRLEREKSKDQIITYYINKVYMSNGIYGMKTAANYYYNKDLSELSLAQTALFAGLPQAPSEYDPYLNPEGAKKRRDLVLQQMYEDKVISKKDYKKAVAEPIDKDLVKQKDTSEEQKIVDNYVTEVINEVKEKTDRDIYSDGLDVYTNIDLDAQEYLYNLVNTDEYINFEDDKLQVAVTVIDPNNGNIISQIGNRKAPEDAQLTQNLATSNGRDFASAMKPLNVYAPAIEYLNYSTAQFIIDGPYKYPGTDQDLMNYDNLYRGTLTMREALIDSRNVPAAKTIREVGFDNVEKLQKKLNIYNEDIGVVDSSAIHQEISSLKMAAAYSAFANGGKYYQPSYVHRIVFNDGSEQLYEDRGTRVMKDSTAYMITDMLKDVINRGTGQNAQIYGIYQAGKTGTSNYDESVEDKVKGDGVPNISFVGYTKDYVIAVWIGYEDFFQAIPKSQQGIAMSIYRNMMSHLMSNISSTDWEQPETVVRYGSELYVKGHTVTQPVTPSYSAPVNTTPSTSAEKEPEEVEEPDESDEPEASKESEESEELEESKASEKPEESKESEESKPSEQPSTEPSEQPDEKPQSSEEPAPPSSSQSAEKPEPEPAPSSEAKVSQNNQQIAIPESSSSN